MYEESSSSIKSMWTNFNKDVFGKDLWKNASSSENDFIQVWRIIKKI